MAWFLVLAAGLLEVVWAYAMKQSKGLTLVLPMLVTVAGMGASIWLLALAMRSLPLGTAYPTWTGIGALGTFVLGVAVLGEDFNAFRLFGACFIVLGIFVLMFGAKSSS